LLILEVQIQFFAEISADHSAKGWVSLHYFILSSVWKQKFSLVEKYHFCGRVWQSPAKAPHLAQVCLCNMGVIVEHTSFPTKGNPFIMWLIHFSDCIQLCHMT